MLSPGFSKFRELMDLWDCALEEENKSSKVDAILNGAGLVMFFALEGDIYGATEDSRVIFAKLKTPDEDTPEGWDEEANFTAINLTKAVGSDSAEQSSLWRVLAKKDLKDIKIIDREEAKEKLKEATSDSDGPNVQFIQLKPGPKDPEEAPNFIHAKER